MNLKLYKVLFISLIAGLWMVQPSTSNPIQNELLEALTIRLNDLQSLLESNNAENMAKIGHLEAKIENLEVKNAKQEEKIVQLEVKLAAQHKFDNSPRLFMDDEHNLQTNGHNEMRSIHKNDGHLVSGDSRPRAVRTTSCRDLALIGHNLDGLYLVQNVDTNKIETVFCDFGTSVIETFIGNLDVKTKSVHFYVQRSTSYNVGNSILPWELSRLNEGTAMNLVTGIFIAPVPGIYHFEFSGVKADTATDLFVLLQVNNVIIGEAFTNPGVTGSSDSVSLTASLRLAVNDQVSLFNRDNGVLYGSVQYPAHFAGWLVEETLV